jgi:neutral ceramidase
MTSKFSTRRNFIRDISLLSAGALIHEEAAAGAGEEKRSLAYHPNGTAGKGWKVGLGKRVITPENGVWLAGYDLERPAEGKLHDLYVKVMALKDAAGKVVVLATTDHQGMSRTVSDRIYELVRDRYGIARENFMLTFSHTHTGPCLEDDMVDYYPSDARQREEVHAYSLWMESKVLEAVVEALSGWQSAELYHGEGQCTFAVNRRENKEEDVPAMLASGTPLKGPVDHRVPVLAIRNGSALVGVLFGYSCHPTTIWLNRWSGDYPGFAQLAIESAFPGTMAMFFNTSGGDQNPLPRGTVELCQQYGKMLSDAVSQAIEGEMYPVSPQLSAAFDYVDLSYESVATRPELEKVAESGRSLQARWAKRMLSKLAADGELSTGWQHVLVNKDSGKLRMYVNGKLAKEIVIDADTNTVPAEGTSLKIGFGPNDYFSGHMREVRLYNRALSKKEIGSLYKMK